MPVRPRPTQIPCRRCRSHGQRPPRPYVRFLRFMTLGRREIRCKNFRQERGWSSVRASRRRQRVPQRRVQATAHVGIVNSNLVRTRRRTAFRGYPDACAPALVRGRTGGAAYQACCSTSSSRSRSRTNSRFGSALKFLSEFSSTCLSPLRGTSSSRKRVGMPSAAKKRSR